MIIDTPVSSIIYSCSLYIKVDHFYNQLWNISNEEGLETAASTVYEPAEDTFLMLDALQLDLEHIVIDRLTCQNKAVADPCLKRGLLLVVELGCGAGLLTAAVGKALHSCESVGVHCLAVDVNPAACHATAQTCQLNGVQVCLFNVFLSIKI
jgi:release factor glutamine methyltransferase